MARKRFARNATIWALIAALANPALMVPWAYGRDTDIFMGLATSVATAEPNILIIMDTSDTMNIPEPWREYAGNYDSHVEYLWNDPSYINRISTQAPADNLFSNAGSSPDGYFYNYSGACPNLANPDCPKDSGFFAGATDADRIALQTAAVTYANGTEPGDPGARNTYRNYFQAQWIYWLPAGRDETDSRLWSNAFNRFIGGIRVSNFSSSNGGASPVVRGGFNYGNIADFTLGSTLRASSGALNRCTASMAELLPSTVYAPTEYPRNSGKWLNQQWLRWERWLNLENSRAASYPGDHATVAYTSGTYRIGYVGAGYDPTVTPYPGPIDPIVNAPASTPHGVAAPPVPNITAFRDNTGTNGSQGLPIRVQDDSGVSGFADDATDSHGGWTTLKSDLGGFTHQATVAGMSLATLQAMRTLYGYPSLAVPNATATEVERFSAWKGNRDNAAVPFGEVTGTPAYYDIRPTTGGQDIIVNTVGAINYTCTRTCGQLLGAASGPQADGRDGANQLRQFFQPDPGTGQYCNPTGVLSGDCQSITGNPLHPSDPPACAPANTTNYFDRNHTGCTWTGRSSKYVEGVGTVYYGGTCSGSCFGANFVLGAANCPSGGTSTNYCNPATAANTAASDWLGTYTIDGTSYTNVTKNVIGQCSDIPDTSQSCAARKPFACVYGPASVAAFCPNQTRSTSPGGASTRFPAYNRNDNENNLVHDCRADEAANNGGANVFMTALKRNFNQPYNTAINALNTTAAYTTNAGDAASSPAIDLYSVNYLNWRFGPRGPNGHPIGRKTRLQIAKDALADLVTATDGVRFGVMTFNSLPHDTTARSSQGSQGGRVIFPVKRMGSNAADPDYANRAALIAAINNQTAKAASPLTEVLYEAYLYYNGRAPRYGTSTAITANFGAGALPAVGGIGNVTDGADASAVSGANYVSPIMRNPTTATPSSCQKNFVIMITDGGPEHDVDASDFVPGLRYTTLAGVVSADTRVDSSQNDTASGHFETPATLPYGQQSRFNETRPDGGYVWLDELAYFMSKADMSPGARHSAAETTNDQLLGTQSVTTYTIGFAGANSPVVQNAAERAGGAYYVAEDSAQLSAALTDTLIKIRNFTPTVAAPTVPLSALNRAQNALDVYLAFFAPSPSQTWKGTVKRFRIGVGPSDCGPTKDLCLIGKTVLASGFKDVEKLEIDPLTNFEQVVVDPESVSYWNPVTVKDGSEPNIGGTGHQLISQGGAYTPAGRNVYTFLSSNALSPPTTALLTDASNLVSETNTRITKTMLGNAGMSDAARSTLINYVRGGNPGDAACSDAHDPLNPTPCVNWRTWAHADVQHSRPVIVTYNSTPVADAEVPGSDRSTTQYLFFLTNDGLLHAIDAATGQEQWAFLVEEALPQLNAALTNANGPSLDLADGSPVAWVDRGDGDGIVDGAERVWLYFGLRRGGRAYYALDITNINAPRFMWRITPTERCVGAACTASTDYALLGQSWSTPVVARVAATTGTSGARPAGNTDPVVIFGGGYDPQQDTYPLPAGTTSDNIGRAVFIAEGSNGALVKRFSNNAGDFLNASAIDWSIPSDLTVINTDLDAQNLMDRIVVGDVGGDLWRFDISDTNATLWRGKRLAILSDPGVPNRKILFPPVVVPQLAPFPVEWDAVYVGTGDREHPLVTPTSDKMFMVADFDVHLTATAGTAASFANGDFLALAASDTGGVVPNLLVTKRGWSRDLDPGEKVTGSPFVFNQKLRFSTYNPSAVSSECLPPGEGRLNEINALYGNLMDLNGDGSVSARDRYYAGVSRGYFSPLQTVIIGSTVYTIALAGGNVTTTTTTTEPPGGSPCRAGSQFWYCREQRIGIAQRTYWYMEPEQ
ncbi:MAG: hypothetical protein IT531_10475 [Burkholderiales bacterium]|nr:hypothetical protein [Burkholderiales bacterium]